MDHVLLDACEPFKVYLNESSPALGDVIDPRAPTAQTQLLGHN